MDPLLPLAEVIDSGALKPSPSDIHLLTGQLGRASLAWVGFHHVHYLYLRLLKKRGT
jgi:hypothetical protein